MSAQRVRLCAQGPLLLDGPVEVRDEDGRIHSSERPRVAICRCGASAAAPWCDGTHKRLGGPRRGRS